MKDVEKAVHAEIEKSSRLEGEWFSAHLLSLVDRFFNVQLDVSLKRAQSRKAIRATQPSDSQFAASKKHLVKQLLETACYRAATK